MHTYIQSPLFDGVSFFCSAQAAFCLSWKMPNNLHIHFPFLSFLKHYDLGSRGYKKNIRGYSDLIPSSSSHASLLFLLLSIKSHCLILPLLPAFRPSFFPSFLPSFFVAYSTRLRRKQKVASFVQWELAGWKQVCVSAFIFHLQT